MNHLQDGFSLYNSNNKMQKILTINEIKVYSRKEIVAWVQSTNTSSF